MKTSELALGVVVMEVITLRWTKEEREVGEEVEEVEREGERGEKREVMRVKKGLMRRTILASNQPPETFS